MTTKEEQATADYLEVRGRLLAHVSTSVPGEQRDLTFLRLAKEVSQARQHCASLGLDLVDIVINRSK